MKKRTYIVFQIVFIFFVLITLGCAKQHSVKITGNSLTLYYKDANAKKIFFASSIDHFHLHPASKGSRHVWQVTVPLHNEFSYFYVVDDVITIPDCTNTVLDDFGSKNCLHINMM